MNDLIHKLQHYDMMKPRIAKQEFQRSLFYDGNEQFIIIGNPKNMVAFLYTSKIVERSITDHYLNHRNVISNQLIIELLEEINGEILEPTKYQGKRKVFK